MSGRVHTKRRRDAPPAFFEAEAAGLAWLAEAGGAQVVRVIAVEPGRIDLEALELTRPTEAQARAFGAALAATHDAGAAGFGVPPDGYSGPTYLGNQELPTRPDGWREWGAFYVEARVLPYARRAAERGHLGGADLRLVEHACDAIAAGDLDDDDPPARIHGDLWNGNVQWTPAGAVLIDPAASGGHRETDLAMLALFGCPFLAAVYEGYDGAHPLRPGWEDRIPLHQLHPLAVHAAGYGPSYGRALTDAARATLDL
ncbi:fructosamine kinase family protein [Amnibacterium sp.]|uniref:fructosamine kinase family protein n=1 Tax=Amnibacterium sp. TaxID=1872496 RepID=UPI00261EEA67|nr:fructosamine kinase family protein [Amnibacterium sp.]MCU1473746.1 phosphotransferase [Amnibacterium sp.]